MKIETWKTLNNDFTNYEVSTAGRIRNKTTKLILKTKPNKNNGYLQVSLHNHGYVKTFNLHRLIIETFLDNPNPSIFTQVNHKNCVKSDNRIENLEYCTPKYNCNYNNKQAHLRKKVQQFTLDGVLMMTWDSLTEVENSLGYKKSNLSNCCNGVLHHAYGFIWRFV